MKRLAVLALATLFAAPALAVDWDQGVDVEYYTKLRFDYAARKDFTPLFKFEGDRKAVVTAYKAGEFDKTIELGNAWLNITPIDADVYLMLAICLKAKGDFAGYCKYMSHFYGLLRSITSTGDGQTPETAFKVISVAEEYYLLNEIGAKLQKQSLVDHYDKMEFTRKDDKEYILYFDVSIPLAVPLDKALK